MRQFLAAMVFFGFLAGPLAATQVGVTTGDESQESIEDRFYRDVVDQAAVYRVEYTRRRSLLPASYDAAAAQIVAQAKTLLKPGTYLDARIMARGAIKQFPFSASTAALQHIVLQTYTIGALTEPMRRELIILWEFYPQYSEIRTALQEVLICLEAMQQKGMWFDLSSEDPQRMVRVDESWFASEPRSLFRILMRYGDRQDIGARAALGHARSILAEGAGGGPGTRTTLLEARAAYDIFLIEHPRHPLVFQALLEQAAAYMLTYRGPAYDKGVLLSAEGIVDQAEVYTQERPERIALVRRARSRVRQYLQERDLYAARWYAAKGAPTTLNRILGLGDPDLLDGARLYYQEVLSRDPASAAAAAAGAELQLIPPRPAPEAAK
jgi:hypothetical protein